MGNFLCDNCGNEWHVLAWDKETLEGYPEMCPECDSSNIDQLIYE